MYLFITTSLISFLSVHSTSIIKYCYKYFNRIPKAERDLLEERKALINDQCKLSISRDFVRYSKLQRKINFINETLKEKGSERMNNNIMYNIGITYGTKVLLYVVMMFLTIYYRQEPVFVVTSNYDLWPFGGIISFPNDYMNSVSVHFWMVCCTSVAQVLKN